MLKTALFAAGRHNREIAAALGTSARNIQVRVMDKLDASSVAELL